MCVGGKQLETQKISNDQKSLWPNSYKVWLELSHHIESKMP